MKKSLTFFLTLSTILFTYIDFSARSFRVAQVPNGSKFSCNTCHTNGGGTPRNNFGKLVQKSFLVQAGSQFNVDWSPLLASLDADGDGVTNGQELQDPFGQFFEGQPNPGSSELVTAPGVDTSTPLTTLTVNFSGMTPHVGQMLYLRVFDRMNNKEVARTSTTIAESFNVAIDAIIPGNQYYVDFFADHNGNGKYDAPPTDHAWRIELDNPQPNQSVDFAHNTDFVDIDWPFLLTVNFTGMTPHIGQLLELRVEDDLTSEEVGRKRIEFIPGADFSVDLPGIEMSKEYNVEIYADLNGNGVYDAPPTDHAWEVKFTNTTGDASIDFAHNTDFKDLGWKYLYTLNFIDMTPHVGQMLEMRVVRNDNGVEVNRTKTIIPGEQFVLSIPQIEIDHDYNVEFYADLNGNGQYDAPPADHAWRISFNSTTGNFVQNFSHNTDFVDINWSNVTSVEDNSVPTQFVLKQNYPNPFNPSTTISFTIAEASNVNLTVFNILGEKISTLIDRQMAQGNHQINFDASNLESGTYFYRLSTKNYSHVKKMVLLK